MSSGHHPKKEQMENWKSRTAILFSQTCFKVFNESTGYGNKIIPMSKRYEMEQEGDGSYLHHEGGDCEKVVLKFF